MKTKIISVIAIIMLMVVSASGWISYAVEANKKTYSSENIIGAWEVGYRQGHENMRAIFYKRNIILKFDPLGYERDSLKFIMNLNILEEKECLEQ